MSRRRCGSAVALGHLVVATALAVVSGAAFAAADADPVLMELKPLLAGAVCIGIGALARRPSRAYLAGVLFALSWAAFGLQLGAVESRWGGFGDTLPIAILCGLLALGPAAAVGAWVCQLGCPTEQPFVNGSAG